MLLNIANSITELGARRISPSVDLEEEKAGGDGQQEKAVQPLHIGRRHAQCESCTAKRPDREAERDEHRCAHVQQTGVIVRDGCAQPDRQPA